MSWSWGRSGPPRRDVGDLPPELAATLEGHGWTYVSRYAYGAEGCTCTRSRGDSKECPLHHDEYQLRQTGCSCWAGAQLADGSWVDFACPVHWDAED
ncbi:hypothetical protein FZI85_25270 [Mycobacterium sp. CBMA293]|uniref:hypothetical protein n=1 Tax=unclassified Mycolicibacterium TaxID=2636767 RepID=UPI0012DE760F|nr:MULTISPECIES: hypothetical protein [unclassified Mycolicibacterium]MUL47626.1 hypothetical protein [Mycolicibacterium sp. CBMA 360]MUL61856.1 hypothetical protein [Mycolicibacterium sp. CBMA 335]MUL68929.1 hypothetical protein [Mycolicibacterium sp. CBMA 311]MUL92854.1 hypothetical protein [Mycolicibacterium sp. CBMA 230]MUM14318.1 hypothetical protein [Mycolicibacterium sp. CBMA 293]